MSEVATVGTEHELFDTKAYDLPIPKDAAGRKGTKLVAQFGGWEADRTSEDDLEVFNALALGETVRLVVECEVVSEGDQSRSGEDGHTVEVRRGLKVVSVERG